MKAGFKPKLFTKKEWQDNRSSAAKGSGVGKGLEAWQKNCPAAIDQMTKAGVGVAFKTAKGLESALDVAAKKCDKKRQKETLAGIGAYKSKVLEYQALLKKALVALDKRMRLDDSLNLDSVMKDANLLKAFSVFAQKKAFIYEVLHTYVLFQKKQFEKAVKLYGKDNDYNIDGRTNQILRDAFGGEDRGTQDLKVVAKALKDLEYGLREMLTDANHYRAFSQYPTYQALVNQRFPIVNFSV